MLAPLLFASVVSAGPPRTVLRWLESPAVHAPAPREKSEGATIVVGTQRLHRCTLVVSGFCGQLVVPLDWLDRSEGTISIRYQWLPAAGGTSAHTIVAEEGGPGYATTGTGNEYRQLFAPLMRERNLLMMDQRGTGGSAPIDCFQLQTLSGYGGGPDSFFKAERLCGDQLNHTYRDASGAYVHASDLFGTSQSVRDLRAILSALQQGPVDFYGDSYGSFFGQVFAARYPRLVRSLVLDSTYPTLHQDPFDRAGQDEIRFGFSIVCPRSLACAADTKGSPLARIARLAAVLDGAPIVTQTTTPIGQPVPLVFAGRDIWTLLSSAGDDFGPYRNLDAAIRSYLDRHDPVPLARLASWTYFGPTFSYYGYAEFSEGMYIADACTVYVNPFDMSDPVAQRKMEYADAVAALGPGFGSPLPNHDVFASPAEWYNECLTWPAPVHFDPIVTRKPPLVPPSLPVLILSGDLDETTSPGDNRQAAGQLGPSVIFVTVPNSIHVPALLDPYHCASEIVREFVVHPGPVATACTAQIPEVRTVGVFPLTLRDQPLPSVLPGDVASGDDLRLSAIAVEAIGDALSAASYAWEDYRPNCGSGYCGPGLRGGSFVASGDLRRVRLQQIAYTQDTVTSGDVEVRQAFQPGDPGIVSATVIARTSDGKRSVRLAVGYDGRLPHELATLAGTTDRGSRINATMPAP